MLDKSFFFSKVIQTNRKQMVKTIQDAFSFLRTEEDYNVYFANKVESIELKYPAATSIDGKRAGIFLIPHKTEKASLLIPYDWTKGHLSSLCFEHNSYKHQTLTQLADKGVLRETGFRTLVVQQLGGPMYPSKEAIAVSDTKHIKFAMLIRDYFRRKKDRYRISPKTGEPIWVMDDIQHLIFEKMYVRKDFSKPHPQRQMYELYMQWRKGVIKPTKYYEPPR